MEIPEKYLIFDTLKCTLLEHFNRLPLFTSLKLLIIEFVLYVVNEPALMSIRDLSANR